MIVALRGRSTPDHKVIETVGARLRMEGGADDIIDDLYRDERAVKFGGQQHRSGLMTHTIKPSS